MSDFSALVVFFVKWLVKIDSFVGIFFLVLAILVIHFLILMTKSIFYPVVFWQKVEILRLLLISPTRPHSNFSNLLILCLDIMLFCCRV